MAKWVKEIKKTVNGDDFTNYVDDDKNTISIIEYSDGRFVVEYHCENMKNKSQFLQEAKSQGYSIWFGNLAETKITHDENELRRFFEIINNYNSISEIKEDIFIKIGATNIKDIFSKTLKKEISIENLIEITLNHQNKGVYNSIWEVINLIKGDIVKEDSFFRPQQLFELIPLVSKDNPFYKSANDVGLHLLYSQDVLPDEKFLFLEEKLKYALKSEQQTLIDQIFHELSGFKGLNPEIKNVKGDADTLLKIAEKMRDLNNKIENLLLKEKISEVEEKSHKSTFWKLYKFGTSD